MLCDELWQLAGPRREAFFRRFHAATRREKESYENGVFDFPLFYFFFFSPRGRAVGVRGGSGVQGVER